PLLRARRFNPRSPSRVDDPPKSALFRESLRFNPRPPSRADDEAEATLPLTTRRFNPRPPSRADDLFAGWLDSTFFGFNPRPPSRADDPAIISACLVGCKVAGIANYCRVGDLASPFSSAEVRNVRKAKGLGISRNF
ncbi:MAG: hypothetical protein KDB03_20885, partial [Planctomycetales bacterium]|nr:hypothetical protein [Planctomycetales bacterium]